MISIITPTYNRAHLLPRMVNSILNQTYKDWELILVDDGSTDNTAEIIQPYLTDERIKYISKNNSGAAHSRNLGVEISKGGYIIFLDSDDEAKKEWLEGFNLKCSSDELGMIFCGFEIWEENNLINIKSPEDLGPVFNNLNGSFVAGSFLLKKEYFELIGGYDIDLTSGQHTELFMRLIPFCIKNNYNTKHLSVPLLKIHLHSGERIRSNHKALYFGTKRILEKHENLLKKSKIDESNYLKIAGYNAFAMGLKKEALTFYYRSFKVDPNMKSLLRLINYKVKSYT